MNGRLTPTTAPGQSNPATYAYDNDGRLTGITQGTAGVSFTYDVAGRRTSLTLPDGIVVNYGYDAASELTGMTYSEAGNVLGNLTYAYDQDGRRIQESGSWARMGVPNPTTSMAVYNADNELTSWNGATLAYDNNGNMTSDGTNTYTWDARNQLNSISGIQTASFEYDPFGRRLQKTVNSATTDFLYDGVNPVQELSGTTVTANLLTGLGVDEYFTRTDSTGTSNFLTDALGSTLALADSTGAVQTEYTYDPYGNTTTQGTASANSFQFTGRENDGDELYYFRARYYDPMFSRFISQDPYGLAAGTNRYVYAADNPTDFGDPLGLWTTSVGVSVGIQWGPVSFQLSGGIAIDSQGNLGGYLSGGAGPGVGASASGGVTTAFSNAQNICDLAGPFANANVGFGEGPDASVDQFSGLSPNGPVLGAGATVGIGIGGGVSAPITYTKVIPALGPLAGRKCGCGQ